MYNGTHIITCIQTNKKDYTVRPCLKCFKGIYSSESIHTDCVSTHKYRRCFFFLSLVHMWPSIGPQKNKQSLSFLPLQADSTDSLHKDSNKPPPSFLYSVWIGSYIWFGSFSLFLESLYSSGDETDHQLHVGSCTDHWRSPKLQTSENKAKTFFSNVSEKKNTQPCVRAWTACSHTCHTCSVACQLMRITKEPIILVIQVKLSDNGFSNCICC